MKNIYQEGTGKLPEITFDYEKGLIEIKGRSIPEDSDALYKPLIEWLAEYVSKPQKKTTVNINLEYFNSSSAKYLTRLLNKLTYLDTNYELETNWYYVDEEALEEGEDFADILDLKMNFYSV